MLQKNMLFNIFYFCLCIFQIMILDSYVFMLYSIEYCNRYGNSSKLYNIYIMYDPWPDRAMQIKAFEYELSSKLYFQCIRKHVYRPYMHKYNTCIVDMSKNTLLVFVLKTIDGCLRKSLCIIPITLPFIVLSQIKM